MKEEASPTGFLVPAAAATCVLLAAAELGALPPLHFAWATNLWQYLPTPLAMALMVALLALLWPTPRTELVQRLPARWGEARAAADAAGDRRVRARRGSRPLAAARAPHLRRLDILLYNAAAGSAFLFPDIGATFLFQLSHRLGTAARHLVAARSCSSRSSLAGGVHRLPASRASPSCSRRAAARAALPAARPGRRAAARPRRTRRGVCIRPAVRRRLLLERARLPAGTLQPDAARARLRARPVDAPLVQLPRAEPAAGRTAPSGRARRRCGTTPHACCARRDRCRADRAGFLLAHAGLRQHGRARAGRRRPCCAGAASSRARSGTRRSCVRPFDRLRRRDALRDPVVGARQVPRERLPPAGAGGRTDRRGLPRRRAAALRRRARGDRSCRRAALFMVAYALVVRPVWDRTTGTCSA